MEIAQIKRGVRRPARTAGRGGSGGGGEVLSGHAVEGPFGGEKAVGGEDVEVGVENEVVSEGVDGGNGTEFALREVERVRKWSRRHSVAVTSKRPGGQGA